MAKLTLIGAVAVKVRPDTSGFKDDTRRDIERQLRDYDPKVKVKGRVDMDTRAAERALDRLQDKGRRELQSIQVIARETKQDIEGAFVGTGRGLAVNKFTDSLVKNFADRMKDAREAAKDAQAEMDEFSRRAMRFPGFTGIFHDITAAKLKAAKAGISGIKGEAKSLLEIDKQFRSSLASSGFDIVQRKIDAIAGSTQKLGRISDDVASEVGKATEAMQAHWDAVDPVLRPRVMGLVQADDNVSITKLETDFKLVQARIAEGWENMTSGQLYKSLVDGASAATDEALAEIQRRVRAGNLENMYGTGLGDRNALRRAAEQLAIQAADNAAIEFEKIRNEADETARHIESLNPSLIVNTRGLLEASAQMRFAARPRTVPFYVKVNAKSLAVAEGVLRSLSGINTLESAGRHLENIVTNLDNFALKSTSIAAAIAAITNSLVYMATTALSVGEGVAQVVGLTALIPTAIATSAAIIFGNIAAWDRFKEAVDGSAEALASLPEEAQAAAVAIRGTWESIQDPVQNSYWASMGTSLQDFVEEMLPPIRFGLTEAAGHMGQFAADVLNTMTELSQLGGMEATVQNLADFFENATGAAEPLTRAINILGLRGAEFMPRFGTWLTDISERFGNFIQEADDAGDITRWIEQGVQSLKDMWSIGGSVIDMFRGLTAAANISGAAGLPEFRDNMRELADTMMGEPFRSRMARIFAGARDGASALNVGVQELNETIGESSLWVERLLVQLGRIGGQALLGLSGTIGDIEFQSGILAGLQGFEDMLVILQPGFEDLGEAIGGISRIAGEVFRGIAPIINTVMELLTDSIDTLGPSLEDLVPHLTGFVDGILRLAAGPIGVVVEGLANLIDGFNGLDDGMQGTILALATFLAFRGHFAPMFQSIQKAADPVFDRLTEHWQLQTSLARGSAEGYSKAQVAFVALGDAYPKMKPLADAMYDVDRNTQLAGRSVAGLGRSFEDTLGGIGTVAQDTAKGVITAFAPIGEAGRTVGRDFGAGFTHGLGITFESMDTVKTGLQGVNTAVRTTLGEVKQEARVASRFVEDTFRRGAISTSMAVTAGLAEAKTAIRNVGNTVAPVGSTLRTLGTTGSDAGKAIGKGFSGLGSVIATQTRIAVGHLGDFAGAAGRATSAVGRTAGQGLRLAVGGLGSALGGPWGIAIMAGITILGAYAKQQAETKAAVDEMTASLDEQTGAATEASNSLVSKALIDDKGISGFKNAADTIKAMGRSVQDTGKIVAEGGVPYNNLIRKLKEGESAAKDAGLQMDSLGGATTGNTKAWEAWLKEMDIAPGKISQVDLTNLISQLEKQGGVSGDAARNWDLMNDSAAKADERVSEFADAMRLLGDETATADDRIRGLDAALAVLNGETPDVDVAIRNLNDSMRNAKSIFKDAEGSVLDFSGTINSSSGKINTVSEAGSNLSKSLQDVQRETKASAVALADGGAKLPEVTAHIQDQRKAWIDSAAASLGSRDAAAAVWDYMIGANPGEIATLITADATNAKNEMKEAERLLERLDARRALVEIAGNDEKLAAKYLNSMDKVDALDKAIATANADMNPEQLEAENRRIKLALIELARTDPTVRALMDPKIFEDRRKELMARIRELGRQKPEPKVLADIADAQDKLRKLTKMLDGMLTKDWEIKASLSANSKLFFDEKERAEAAGKNFTQRQWKAILSARREQFDAVKKGVEAAGKNFSKNTWEAYLTANPNPAKRSTEQARQWAKDFAKNPYKAVMTAVNGQAKAVIADAAAKGKKWSNDDYKAWLEALDKTNPGLAASIRSISNMTGKDYKAVIQALDSTAGGISEANGALNAIPEEEVGISGDWKGWVPPVLQDLVIGVKGIWAGLTGGPGGKGADGAIVLPGGNPFAGQYPMARAFADGGIENHVAQISYSSPQTPIRIWSEPETQGESYIPLAASKRKRSVEIWEQTGRLLGVYENGGINGGASSRRATGERPIHIEIHGVPMDYAQETADTIMTALKQAQRGGVY